MDYQISIAKDEEGGDMKNKVGTASIQWVGEWNQIIRVPTEDISQAARTIQDYGLLSENDKIVGMARCVGETCFIVLKNVSRVKISRKPHRSEQGRTDQIGPELL